MFVVIYEMQVISPRYGSSRPDVFYKKSVLRNYQKRDPGTGAFLWILLNFEEHLSLQNVCGGCFCR